jgi:O-antigen/teichoic acid export membrane protein
MIRLVVVLLLVRDASNIGSVPLAQVIGDAGAALLLLVGVRRRGLRFPAGVDTRLAREVLGRAAPMAATALLAVVIYNVDLIFLRIFRDTRELGLYLAGYTILNFLGVLGHVVALALLPTLTRLRNSTAEFAALFGDSAARVFAAGIPLAVGGTIVAPLLVTVVFGDDFAPSARVLAVLVWSLPLLLLRSVIQAALIAHGRQDFVLRTTFAAALTNVTLNFIAVPLYGMVGAAVTTVVADVVRLIVAAAYARRCGIPRLPLMRTLRSAFAAVAMGAVLLIVEPRLLWTALPLGAAAYGLALLASGGLRIDRNGVHVRL